MNASIRGILALLLVLSLPAHAAFAQEVDPEEDAMQAEAIESAAAEGTVLPAFDGDLEALSIIAAEEEWQRDNKSGPEEPPPPPETGVGIQATYNTQEVASTTMLEGTANPEMASSSEAEVVAELPAEEASSTESIPVVLGAATSSEGDSEEGASGGGAGGSGTGAGTGSTSTTSDEEEHPDPVVIAGPASLEVIDNDMTEGQVIEPESIDVITVIEPEPIAQAVVAEVEAEPEAAFTFGLTGKQIPTKRTEASSDRFTQSDEEIDTALVPIIDNDSGTMHIAGECSDAFYVVLLFKNERDYARDPRSYILNQAFPCEGGHFSYSISELPHTLAAGTYYLLVGQQGIRGAWTPITSLTEITINRN